MNRLNTPNHFHVWLLSKGPLIILISLIFLRFFLSNFLLLSNILVICHITLLLLLLLLLSLRAIVSAISAFLTLGTHCSHISLFNTCFNIVLFVFLNKLMMMMIICYVQSIAAVYKLRILQLVLLWCDTQTGRVRVWVGECHTAL